MNAPSEFLDYGPDAFLFEEQRRIPLGANFVLRRSLVERVGGFDPSLGRNGDAVLLGQELPEFFARTRRVGALGAGERRDQEHKEKQKRAHERDQFTRLLRYR